MNYNFYASSRQPVGRVQTKRAMPKLRATRQRLWPAVVTLAVVVGLIIGFKSVNMQSSQTPPQINSSNNVSSSAAAASISNHCAGNNLSQLIKVSISGQHLWACQGSKAVYDTPVITGMEAHDSTRTPTGTYHIYAKQTNLTLTGSDETGSWSDPVSYWMPFLSNQYGTYGFHDATWRTGNPFGKINPNSNQASHGCVELPLSAAQWLYNWAQVGTTITIQS